MNYSMTWPSFDKLNKIAENINAEIRVSAISKDQIQIVISNLRQWYPAIQVGAESKHLSDRFYLNDSYLADGDSARPNLPLIVTSQDGTMVGFISFQIDRSSEALTSLLGVVNPLFRGKGIAYFGPCFLEAIGKQMNVGLIYYYVTLETIAQQKVAEALGFSIVGIFPSWDRDLIDGSVQRVSEAVYAKPLRSFDQERLPNQDNLTERTKLLWKFLFEEEKSGG